MKTIGPKLPPDTDAIIDRVLAGDLSYVVGDDSGWASGDVSIWYERISPQGLPKGCVLLLVGMGGDGLMWPPSFVRAFVDAGFQVIRYDHRGTGMSDWVENWSSHQPYTLADMAGDALAVLDTLQVPQAHLVGLSMGSMIAQEVALQAPHRVATLTLIMTSGHIGDPDLPQTSARYFLDNLIKGLPLLRYRLMGGEAARQLEQVVSAAPVVAGLLAAQTPHDSSNYVAAPAADLPFSTPRIQTQKRAA